MRTKQQQSRLLSVVVTLTALSGTAVANAQAATGFGPVPRPLPAPSITSPQFAGAAFNLIALPNGQLLVNDTRNHRVMLSDSTMRQTTVVIDSAEYGFRGAALMSYRGDSVMFVEGITPSMTLIDPSGRVVRSLSVPNVRDVGWLMPAPMNVAGVDARGWFVHRGLAPRAQLPRIKPGEIRNVSNPDSTPLVRDNPATHTADTITWVKSTARNGVEVAGADGRVASFQKSSPIEVIDQWAVLSSGRLAVLRGRDYHLDLFDVNGMVTALPRIPFPWERLSDSAKAVLVDSANRARAESLKSPPKPLAVGGSSPGGSGSTNTSLTRADFPPPPPGVMDSKPADLPDYRAVFRSDAVRPDMEDNVWVPTTHPTGDTTTISYDVVSSAGVLVDRILVPRNRTIIGFDRHGNIFLAGKAAGGIQWIERVRWRK